MCKDTTFLQKFLSPITKKDVILHPDNAERMIYILISIFIVAILVSARKKPNKSPSPASADAPDLSLPKTARTPKAKQPKMRKMETNSPKNEEYFTYETLEPETFTSGTPTPISSDSFSENYQQNAENEQQNNINLELDANELKKGVIYSIILKKPDF